MISQGLFSDQIAWSNEFFTSYTSLSRLVLVSLKIFTRGITSYKP
jgi:hypothetical protein